MLKQISAGDGAMGDVGMAKNEHSTAAGLMVALVKVKESAATAHTTAATATASIAFTAEDAAASTGAAAPAAAAAADAAAAAAADAPTPHLKATITAFRHDIAAAIATLRLHNRSCDYRTPAHKERLLSAFVTLRHAFARLDVPGMHLAVDPMQTADGLVCCTDAISAAQDEDRSAELLSEAGALVQLLQRLPGEAVPQKKKAACLMAYEELVASAAGATVSVSEGAAEAQISEATRFELVQICNQLYAELVPEPHHLIMVQRAHQRLQAVLERRWRDCRVYIFGSSAAQLATANSDVDMNLDRPGMGRSVAEAEELVRSSEAQRCELEDAHPDVLHEMMCTEALGARVRAAEQRLREATTLVELRTAERDAAVQTLRAMETTGESANKSAYNMMTATVGTARHKLGSTQQKLAQAQQLLDTAMEEEEAWRSRIAARETPERIDAKTRLQQALRSSEDAIEEMRRRKANVYVMSRYLETSGYTGVKPVARARVPVIKVVDPYCGGIAIDLVINNHHAVHNTRLMKAYAQFDERCRQLIFIIKHWAKCRRLNEASMGTLSSYSLSMMVVHYLQGVGILPNLQGPEAREVALRAPPTRAPPAAQAHHNGGANRNGHAEGGYQQQQQQHSGNMCQYGRRYHGAGVYGGEDLGDGTLSPYICGSLDVTFLDDMEAARRLPRHARLPLPPFCSGSGGGSGGDGADIASLLVGFFRYFALQDEGFDHKRHVVTVHLDPQDLPRLKEGLWARGRKWRTSIEDPFETANSAKPHDLGSVISTVGQQQFLSALSTTHDQLSSLEPSQWAQVLFPDLSNQPVAPVRPPKGHQKRGGRRNRREKDLPDNEGEEKAPAPAAAAAAAAAAAGVAATPAVAVDAAAAAPAAELQAAAAPAAQLKGAAAPAAQLQAATAAVAAAVMAAQRTRAAAAAAPAPAAEGAPEVAAAAGVAVLRTLQNGGGVARVADGTGAAAGATAPAVAATNAPEPAQMPAQRSARATPPAAAVAAAAQAAPAAEGRAGGHRPVQDRAVPPPPQRAQMSADERQRFKAFLRSSTSQQQRPLAMLEEERQRIQAAARQAFEERRRSAAAAAAAPASGAPQRPPMQQQQQLPPPQQQHQRQQGAAQQQQQQHSDDQASPPPRQHNNAGRERVVSRRRPLPGTRGGRGGRGRGRGGGGRGGQPPPDAVDG